VAALLSVNFAMLRDGASLAKVPSPTELVAFRRVRF
jgi:hypothetical protein